MGFADTYTSIENRLKDWLVNKPGGNVTNLPLDLINRAQYQLWLDRDWDSLMTTSALTLSAARVATLPAAIVKYNQIKDVFIDTDADGHPDRFYYRNGEKISGFKFEETFAKATGSTFTMTFFTDPSATLYVRYKKILVDFAGTGTEYSYFPSDLLLKRAQMLWVEGGGNAYEEYANIQVQYNKDFQRYCADNLYKLADSKLWVRDNLNNAVEMAEVSLDQGAVSKYPSPYSNDTIVGDQD